MIPERTEIIKCLTMFQRSPKIIYKSHSAKAIHYQIGIYLFIYLIFLNKIWKAWKLCYSDLMIFWNTSHPPMGFSSNTIVSACSIQMLRVLKSEG